MMLGLDLESESLCAALELFKRMEVAEAIYEGAIAPSKNKHPREYSNQSRGRKYREDNPPRLQVP